MTGQISPCFVRSHWYMYDPCDGAFLPCYYLSCWKYSIIVISRMSGLLLTGWAFCFRLRRMREFIDQTNIRVITFRTDALWHAGRSSMSKQINSTNSRCQSSYIMNNLLHSLETLDTRAPGRRSKTTVASLLTWWITNRSSFEKLGLVWPPHWTLAIG